MRKVSLVAVFLVFCGCLAFGAGGELGVGYDYLHVDCNGCNNASVPAGFFIDGTYYFAHVLGLTGDFQYHHKDFGGGDTGRLLSFHAGPRLKARISKIEPFGHVLFGVTNVNLSSPGVPSVSDNSFSIKLGGGLDVALMQHFAVRLGEFNYYLTKFGANSNVSLNGQDHQNNFTFGAGIVIR